MSSYIDPDYSIGRNLRQRQRRIGVYNANEGIDSDKNKRKGKKKGQCFGKNSAYDEYGNIRINGLDICEKIKNILSRVSHKSKSAELEEVFYFDHQALEFIFVAPLKQLTFKIKYVYFQATA